MCLVSILDQKLPTRPSRNMITTFGHFTCECESPSTSTSISFFDLTIKLDISGITTEKLQKQYETVPVYPNTLRSPAQNHRSYYAQPLEHMPPDQALYPPYCLWLKQSKKREHYIRGEPQD